MNDNTQDEGRIDPFDMPPAMGISEFARLEELAADAASLTGDERAFEGQPIQALDQGSEPTGEWYFPSAEQAAQAVENPDMPPTAFGGVFQPYETSGEDGDDKDTAQPAAEPEAEMGADLAAEVVTLDEAPPVEVLETMAPRTKASNPKDAAASGKPTYANVPVPVLYEIGAALLEGARKYGSYNWRVAGVLPSVYIDATRRHLDSWWEGEDIDPDSGLSHITKAIASLVVFRDAMIQGMIAEDNRPPRTQVPFMAGMTNVVSDIIERYPDPVPPFTQEQVGHIRDEPVNITAGRVLGFDIEVQLPGPPEHPEGFVWAQQGGTRDSLDLALSVAQALRDDGYGQRVIRVVGIFERVEVMYDGTEYVSGEPMREQVTTVFPGDPSLTEEEEA